MAQPDQTAPPGPEPSGRRARVDERTKHLRTMGVAGAVATLGVFAGLAAVTHGGSSSAQPATDRNASDDATRDSLFDEALDRFKEGDFFDSDGLSGILPGIDGSSPGTTSGGS